MDCVRLCRRALGFNRAFAAERENAGLEGMRLAPVDPGAIYLGKMLANLFFMGIAEVVVVFAASLWYNFSFIPALGWFALITFFCTLGYVAVGTTFGAVASNTRMREVMLPVLQFPVAVPILCRGRGNHGRAERRSGRRLRRLDQAGRRI